MAKLMQVFTSDYFFKIIHLSLSTVPLKWTRMLQPQRGRRCRCSQEVGLGRYRHLGRQWSFQQWGPWEFTARLTSDRRMGCFTAETELYAMTDDESRGTPSWTQRGMFHLQSPTWTPGLCLVCQDTRGMGISNNVDNSELKLPPLHKRSTRTQTERHYPLSLTLSSLPTLSVPLCYLLISVFILYKRFVIFKWIHLKNSGGKKYQYDSAFNQNY